MSAPVRAVEPRIRFMVRDLYRRFLWVGLDYPLGQAFVRKKAKAAIFANRDMTDEAELKKAIHKGRWMVKELIGVVQLKKYRTINERYNRSDDVPAGHAELLEKWNRRAI